MSDSTSPVPENPTGGGAAQNQDAADLDAVRKVKDAHERIRKELEKTIVGLDEVIDQLLISVFARGHCLLVGVPGLAKTLLISSVAKCLSLSFNRIQFTPDLMPADITGTEVIQEDRATGNARLQVPQRSDLRERDPGRRDQPDAAQDAGRAPRGDAGAPGHRRRHRSHELDQPRSSCSPPRTPSSRRAPIPLPEAQLDRFMFMVKVAYPSDGRGAPASST